MPVIDINVNDKTVVKCFVKSGTSKPQFYVGHPIRSDNCLISLTLLLKSEFYYHLQEAVDVANTCLKYGVLITT